MEIKYMKAIIAALLSAALFYFGMKDFANVESSDIAAAELYGNYPTVSQAKQIWESCQNGDEITDVCFLWNGGIQEIKNQQYSRQTNARVTGVTGMAELYDQAGAVLAPNDKDGCVIDKGTALELFGSENCVGSELTAGGRQYQVRGVADWKEHMLLVRPWEKDLLCTQVLVRSRKGQSLEGAMSGFLMGNGLSGTLVDDSWLDVILPWFPVAFLVMFIMAVSEWMSRWFIYSDSVKKNEPVGENAGCRDASRNLQSMFLIVIRILLCVMCLFFSIKVLTNIPQSWLPDKWSDFSFWPVKIRKTMEAFQWYIMFPKTMAQAERLINGISCMIKCGAAALFVRVV